MVTYVDSEKDILDFLREYFYYDVDAKKSNLRDDTNPNYLFNDLASKLKKIISDEKLMDKLVSICESHRDKSWTSGSAGFTRAYKDLANALEEHYK